MDSKQPSIFSSSTHSILTFSVGGRWYAVDVQLVFEVYLMMAITAVPDMPDAILGIVNLRGQIVPVVDLRIRFNSSERSQELTTPIIFVRHLNQVYGMVVDDVDDVVQIPIESIKTTQLNQRANHIQGLTDHRGKLIMILDPVKLMSSSLEDISFEDLTGQIQQRVETDIK